MSASWFQLPQQATYRCSKEYIQFLPVVCVDAIILQPGIAPHQRVLGTDVEIIVQPPVYLPDLPCGVKQPLHAAQLFMSPFAISAFARSHILQPLQGWTSECSGMAWTE